MDRRIVLAFVAATLVTGACSDSGGDEASSASSTTSPGPAPGRSAPPAADGLDPCQLLTDADAAELLNGPTDPPAAGDRLDQLSSGLDLEAGEFTECTWQATEPGTGGDPDRNFKLALNIARGDEAVALFEAAAASVDYAEYDVSAVGDLVLVGGDTTFFGAIVRAGDTVIQCDVTNFRSAGLERATDEICVDALRRAVEAR